MQHMRQTAVEKLFKARGYDPLWPRARSTSSGSAAPILWVWPSAGICVGGSPPVANLLARRRGGGFWDGAQVRGRHQGSNSCLLRPLVPSADARVCSIDASIGAYAWAAALAGRVDPTTYIPGTAPIAVAIAAGRSAARQGRFCEVRGARKKCRMRVRVALLWFLRFCSARSTRS